jgi:hypothetical protein
VTGENLSPIQQFKALIMGAFHVMPSEDIDEFYEQANMALWYVQNVLHPKADE